MTKLSINKPTYKGIDRVSNTPSTKRGREDGVAIHSLNISDQSDTAGRRLLELTGSPSYPSRTEQTLEALIRRHEEQKRAEEERTRGIVEAAMAMIPPALRRVTLETAYDDKDTIEIFEPKVDSYILEKKNQSRSDS